MRAPLLLMLGVALAAAGCIAPPAGAPGDRAGAERQPVLLPSEERAVLAWVREGPIDRFGDPGKTPDYPRSFSEEAWIAKGAKLPHVAEALIALLAREDVEHPSWDGGRLAVALGFLGDKSQAANDVLVRVLDSKSDTVRREAAIALKTQGNRSAAPALLSHLVDPSEDYNVRINACEALVDLGPSAPPAQSAFGALSNDSDALLRRCAAQGLRARGER